eukprot:scaffold38786_cov31-Tisochrysis_lutea.AAC.5
MSRSMACWTSRVNAAPTSPPKVCRLRYNKNTSLDLFPVAVHDNNRGSRARYRRCRTLSRPATLLITERLLAPRGGCTAAGAPHHTSSSLTSVGDTPLRTTTAKDSDPIRLGAGLSIPSGGLSTTRKLDFWK